MLSLYLHNQLADLTREEGSREGRREERRKEGGGKEEKAIYPSSHLPFLPTYFVPPCSSNTCMPLLLLILFPRLRLLSDDPVDLAGTPMDVLCSHLQQRLQYSPGERDAIFLHHIINIEWPDNSKVSMLSVLSN